MKQEITKRLSKLILVSLCITKSLSCLAQTDQFEMFNTNEGYPFNLLLKRTEQVKLIYKGKHKVTCHVEVRDEGKVWIGETYNAKLTKFSQAPLSACMDRELAKKIVRTTF
jgi:hypothetical protein